MFLDTCTLAIKPEDLEDAEGADGADRTDVDGAVNGADRTDVDGAEITSGSSSPSVEIATVSATTDQSTSSSSIRSKRGWLRGGNCQPRHSSRRCLTWSRRRCKDAPLGRLGSRA